MGFIYFFNTEFLQPASSIHFYQDTKNDNSWKVNLHDHYSWGSIVGELYTQIYNREAMISWRSPMKSQDSQVLYNHSSHDIMSFISLYGIDFLQQQVRFSQTRFKISSYEK